MRRHGKLFEAICNKDNLRLANKKARLGKTHYRDVKLVDNNLEHYIDKLHESLIDKTFTTSPYRVFKKQCGQKLRTIHSLPYFPDRIVQHAIMQIVEPILVRTFIRDTFQSLKGRGTSDCRKRVEKALDESLYVLKLDINQFYPSIDNKILKTIVRRKIKCEGTLELLDDIIDSTKGLPIWNYSSQILGNFYLYGLDHYAKDTLHIKYYFRYCDDIVVFADKNIILEYKYRLFDYLQSLKLEIKNTWQIFPLKERPLDYVGYIFHHNKTRIRRTTKANFIEKARFIKRNHKKLSRTHMVSSLMSYSGHMKYANCRGLWNRYVDSELIAKLK